MDQKLKEKLEKDMELFKQYPQLISAIQMRDQTRINEYKKKQQKDKDSKK